MRALWRRLITFGFRLLYNELAWTYDPVSWVTSRGLWRRWQGMALAYLPVGGRFLEVGFGPGHLLADLARGGDRRQVVGLDLSRAMLRQAQRRMARRGLAAPLVRGRAQALPFAAGAFDAVVLTFPTPFVYELAWIEELARVLQGGGRLVVVEQAEFKGQGLLHRFLEWLYDITGQRGPAPDLPGRLEAAGLAAWRENVAVDSTTVGLVLAERRGRD
jgi:ubiquinone/menaquinone biosynthesis C-methylase UbiE